MMVATSFGVALVAASGPSSLAARTRAEENDEIHTRSRDLGESSAASAGSKDSIVFDVEVPVHARPRCQRVVGRMIRSSWGVGPRRVPDQSGCRLTRSRPPVRSSDASWCNTTTPSLVVRRSLST